MIPFFELKAQYQSIKKEIDETVADVLASGLFVLGPRVEVFEKKFAAYMGSAEAIGVGSGTDALHLALVAAGVKRGDEVVTTPNTAVPTVSAIRAAGAEPAFVDIDEKSYTLDPLLLEERLKKGNGRVKAVVPVHLYGQTADMDPIIEIAGRYGATVIEDACQSHSALYKGRKAGTMGLMGCFSFYPTKNLGAYGDGGMVITSDKKMAERLRLLRNYGQSDRYHSVIDGFNSRLDELQAAVLTIKLDHLDKWTQRRRQLAFYYNKYITAGSVVKPEEAPYATHVYHLYVIRHSDRDGLQKHLAEKSVSSLIHYPVPLHLQEALKGLGLAEGSFPISERAAAEILSLPIYPELTDDQVEEVAEAVNSYNG